MAFQNAALIGETIQETAEKQPEDRIARLNHCVGTDLLLPFQSEVGICPTGGVHHDLVLMLCSLQAVCGRVRDLEGSRRTREEAEREAVDAAALAEVEELRHKVMQLELDIASASDTHRMRDPRQAPVNGHPPSSFSPTRGPI